MKIVRYSLISLALAGAGQFGLAQDVKGCKDSPLIGRFPGSVITACKDKDDDAFVFDVENGKVKKTIEGELHQLTYKYPESASKPQVIRNLNAALRKVGYTFDYDSGAYGDFTVHMGKTWIEVEVSAGNTWYRVTVVKETVLKQEVVADAAALSSGLNTNGHMIVTGILFDTGKAEVKPESARALEEVVKLLKQDAKLKVWVVGHTDNVGALAANIDLSRRRAAAVVQLLTTKYGVGVDRLQAFGDGPYAPIGSNDSEDGRSVNRRVELVKQ